MRTTHAAVILFLSVLVMVPATPALAQNVKNPSLSIQEVEIPWFEFNRVGRDASTVQLYEDHPISWQITITNNILYANPLGNAVLRIHDAFDVDRFIEVGMGANPDHKFWLAAQMPREGYVVIHSKTDRGWFPDARVNLSYTDRGGLTVNNGERIVVSNLDVGTFVVGSYSVFGMEATSDPQATNSGLLLVEFLSGNPTDNIYALFPFVVTAAVGILVGVLFISKRRS
ncbi:MAG: hypothetical protein F4Y82_00855 [Cenarchaeum sp. SB0665_bin_23]|nr:hypothetical protein [Cenarchaeum sp. SB0667_bin_13]MXY37568.1 hypothetical protein [Cenarchaeum sp. SB0664_bin_35]MXY60654.1 hypothetical protein [Cenarchaeum sp. SB0665_bin_23]MXZ93059.1 hypothetical protein [Cenarchaeum sp. SB0666_bin_15]MYB46126.1 hypothetical protein [Cenarchaeum sp. SB0662_bin_33]MYC79711.1 hypothetical protein [Cenarchaeum sp. SB0661_bin_35]MYD58151.1 hypothetical protein [Cenarchaeum sp. SB0678_bin_8]MYG33316.1 hypothetical protein [Cenarchaeum sp. SB0677_bin_16]